MSNSTLASFIVTELLIQPKKPFEDEDVTKEVMCKVKEGHFYSVQNKKKILLAINNTTKSSKTVPHRTYND